MANEEMIKKATDFETELSALAKKYGITTYSFVSFMEYAGLSACPVMTHWVRDGVPIESKHPKIIKLCFQGSVSLVRAMTGRGLMHEHYEGFGRFDTGMRDI